MTFDPLAPRQHDSIDGVPEPSENPHLVGHKRAAEALASAYKSGRLHHALLLAGPAGIGKATFAFHLARHVLASSPAEAPAEKLAVADPESTLFRLIAQNAHPSVLHLTRPANEKTKGFKTVITVEEIRRVGRFLSLSAADGGYRIVIVDPADDLNSSAANALLKNLEEPPARTIFMLVANAPGRLVPTIRSRCQIVRFDALNEAEVIEAIDNVGLALPQSADAHAQLARRAGGSVRSAILLTEYGGLEITGAIDTLLTSQTFDLSQAARIADAVTGRDQTIQFALFNDHLMEALASGARAVSGDSGQAGRLANAWSRLRIDLAATETYNLDKRHHVMTALRGAHQCLGI